MTAKTKFAAQVGSQYQRANRTVPIDEIGERFYHRTEKTMANVAMAGIDLNL